MRKVYYNKLIRDKIPEKITESGGEYKINKLTKKEYEKELIKKVGEEASGLLAAKNKRELIKELADVLDVVEEIKKFKKIDTRELRSAQKKNADTKGGFKKKLFLYWSSDTGYKTNEIRYKYAKPGKNNSKSSG